MNPHDQNVQINAGPNSWLVIRTDRDAAAAADVVASLGTILNKWLNHASPAGLRGVFQTLHTAATGGRFVIGAARPIIAHPHRERPPTPEGLSVSSRSSDSPLVRRVRGSWYLSVTFEWHGGAVRIPWPCHQAHVLGSESVNDLELDWLLLETHEASK